VLVLLGSTVAAAQPDDARTAYERGRRLYELGSDLPGAHAELSRAIALRPDLAEAYLYRALVVDHDATYAQSGPDFREAQRLAPGMKEVWRHHADALVRAGDAVTARAYYLVAIALDPAYGDAWYMLGRLHRKQGDLAAAIRAYQRDAAINPKGSARHELGEVFLALGDDARAAREFELDLGIDPTCYESRVNLAGLLLERGDHAGARRHFEESLTYHPADARSLAGLGRAYLALGEDELALGALRQAADLAPDDDRVADDLGAARWRLRLRYGWPLAALPSALLLSLVVHHLRVRKRLTKREEP
jgi:tetratricopeptide (TPR) repeat protein